MRSASCDVMEVATDCEWRTSEWDGLLKDFKMDDRDSVLVVDWMKADLNVSL